MNSPERPLAPFDTVKWERDGGDYSGMIYQIRGSVADILTGHGTALVYVEDLTVILPAEEWDQEALENHLRVAYGVSLIAE